MFKLILFFLFFLNFNPKAMADDSWCIQNGGKVACSVAEQLWTSPRGEKSYNYTDFLHYACMGTTYPTECSTSGIKMIYPSYGNMPILSVDVTKRHYYYKDGDYVFNYEQKGVFTLNSERRCPLNQLSETIPVTGSTNWIRVCKPYNFNVPTRVIPNESKQTKNMCSAKNGSAFVGDPIDIASGNKTLSEIDYKYNSVQDLIIKRDYSSAFGFWRFDFQRNLSYSNINGEFISLDRQSGQRVILKNINGIWSEYNSNIGFSIIEMDSNGIKLQTPNFENEYYELMVTNDSFKVYRLTYIENTKKQKWLYEYTGLLLTKISNDYGKELNLEYGNICKINPSVITVTGNKKYQYEYNSDCTIKKVTYPDLSFKQYLYQNIINGYYTLTKIIDENNNTSQLTSYYNSKASTEGMGDTGSIEKFSMTYDYNYNPNKIQIKDGNNNFSIVTTEKVDNFSRIIGYDSYCPSCNGFQGSLLSYDTNGFVNGVKDYKDVTSNFQYNSAGNISQIKNAVGTPIERQINYTYDSTGKYIISKIEPVSGGNKITSYTYDVNKNITEISITAPKNDGTNTTITKNLGIMYDIDQLTEIRGVNYASNNNDKITLTYNSDGQIQTTTNELGQVTTYSSHDDYGHPNQITLPNLNVINFTYDLRGRITSSSIKSSSNSIDAETTTYTYDLAGLLIKITNPSSSFSKMTYDTAHRLTKIEEYSEPTPVSPTGVYLGKIQYTLDNMSKATSVKIFNANNVQERISTSQFDNKNRLFKTIGTLNQTTTYNYDANSNLSQVTDAGNYSFGNTYDALNRVVSMTYPDNSTVSMTYNLNDDVATVTDPKGLTTSYTYDGFSNVIKIQSPDTGTTILSYDKKNNLISKQDNKNQVSNYTYDLLGRLKNVNYVGSTSENITLNYDTCNVGSLCTMIDNSGTTTYTYNAKARLVNKTFTPVGSTLIFSTNYYYDNVGNVSSVNYPSITAPGFSYTGSSINYSYENGKIKDISKSSITPIISNITYATLSAEPKSFTAGLYNHSKDINQDGVFNSINNSQTNSYSKDYTYDSRFNIKSINGQAVPVNKSLSAVYDSKSRIVGTGYSEGGISTSFGYGYNTSDDRTVATKASGTYNYSYPTDSHKLTAITGVNEFTYDLNGNIITSSNNGVTEITMGYNNANRLISSNSSSGDATYTYNALNQRVKKIVNLGGSIETTWFIYDENGQLIADYINKNNVWSVSEYVYLYDKPVGIIRDSSIYHIQTDHINTPRSITKAIDGSLVWSWENKEVFGNNLPNENLSANIFKFNLRFMGQYYDEEKGTSYNYHRDYASGMGRYLQSDPIGLAGGTNTYGYVSGNSLIGTDRFGLETSIVYIQDSYIKVNHMAIDINGTTYQHGPDGKLSLPELALNINYAGVTGTINLKELVKHYIGLKIYKYTLNLSEKDENKLENFLKNSLTDNKRNYYNTYTNNCTTYVGTSLLANGIFNYSGENVPHLYWKYILNNYPGTLEKQ